MLNEETLLMIGITIFAIAIVLALLTIGSANASPSTRVLAYEIVCVDNAPGYCNQYSVYKVVQE
jgi:hypothetical protein